jgi:chromosome segregation and condensation protein ScpB
VDYIRGVNSHLAIRKLSELGLIEKIENPRDFRSYLYKAGVEFLKKSGLNKLEDLPEYDKLSTESFTKDEI